MRSLYLRFTAILLFVSVFPAAAQQSTAIYQGKQVIAKQLILRLRNNDQQALARVASRLPGATVTPLSSTLGVHIIKSDVNNVEALMASYGPDNDILYAEPNYVVHGTATPSDSQFSSLWGLRKISAPQAWDVFTGSRSTAVGIIDTGIDYTHPDLAQNVWSAPWSYSITLGGKTIVCPAGSHGFNAIDLNCDPKDENSHGSHVSGTIGAVGNNSVGVAGINWSTQIVAIKFLDASGSGSLADAINGIEFAIQLNKIFASSSSPVNVRVLSASWGANDFSQSLFDEINAANDNGILFVAAAGNSGSNSDRTPFYPAGFTAPNVIAVAATDSNDAIASFSNYGGGSVHVAAPGVDILSTVSGGGYASYTGTSMATPHVSGAALLTLGACPGLSTAQLKAVLLGTVDNFSSLQGKTITGGRINVNAAIQACRNSVIPAPIPTSSCSASVSSDHWKGEYFNNMTLSGTPLMVRDDGTGALNFAWGNEVSPNPGCSLPGTGFSVRWTRVVTFGAGTYRFNTSSDDGMRLYIDGAKVLDRWYDQGANPITTDVPVAGGTHTVVVEYYQNGGGESAAVSWQQLTSTSTCIATVASDHWKGEYFNNISLSGNLLMVRDDGTGALNVNWGNEGSPNSSCNVPGRQYSVRWTRAITFNAGTYAFTTSSDDGMRVYVDGQRIVDRWFDQGASPFSTNVSLSAGTHTVVVEYYQDGGMASAAVNWQSISAPSVPPLSISSITPGTVTAGTSPTLTVTGSGLDSTFRAFIVSGSGQSSEIGARTFITSTLVQVTPVLASTADSNAKLQIVVGTQSASIALPILPQPGVTTVSITNPSTGATVSGTVTVSAAATTSPWQTITGLQFRVDNGNQGSALIASPYNLALDTTKLSNGSHTLTAVVTDSSGASTVSAPVSIVVNNSSGGSSTALITSFSPRGVRNDSAWAGMQFTVGSGNIRVTSLGRMVISGNSRSHVVKLVNANTGADVPGAAVSVTMSGGTPGQFVYASLGTPVTLPGNTSYFLVSEEVSGGDQWYDVSYISAVNAVSVNSPVIWAGSRWYQMGIANASYVPVSLLYQ